MALEEVRLEILGRRHEPYTHACDDAEVRLREQSIERGPNPPTIQRCEGSPGKPGEACFQAFTGWQDHFEATDLITVLTHRRVAKATLQCVADDAAFRT